MEWLRRCRGSYHLTDQVFPWQWEVTYMYRYNRQRLLYAQINKSSIQVMDSKKVGERLGYPLIISQLFTRDSHQNKALCWTELLSAGGGRQKLSVFLTSLNLIGYWGIGWGVGGRAFHLDIATFPLFIRTRRPMVRVPLPQNCVVQLSRFLLPQSANFWYSPVSKNHSRLAKLFMSIYHHDHPIKTPLSRYRFTKSIYLVYTKYILSIY